MTYRHRLNIFKNLGLGLAWSEIQKFFKTTKTSLKVMTKTTKKDLNTGF